MNDARPTASPCIRVCELDHTRTVCVGCLRTVDEIARWSVMNEETRQQVVARVRAARLQQSKHSEPIG
ncbi:DUF1289 domain-containing protein [Planctomicrobium sp. SH661]|uniref:DUF1289 domain-containing protein n=1 Tax=Planctomicrobium sp. SH661 TaxID=3448124 RepID=UPI003F5BDC57